MKNIIRIVRISRPLYRIILGLAILILSTAIIQQISPIISKYIVDEIEQNIKSGSGDLNRLSVLIVVAFAANFVAILLNSFTERLGDHFAGRMRKYLLETFYGKVLSLPQTYFDSEVSGKIVNQLNRGIFTIQDFMNTSTNFILPSLLQSTFTIAILAYYNIPVAIFISLLFPIYISLSYYSTKKWGKEEEKKNKLEDVSRGRIQEVISNIKLVKSFGTERSELEFIESKQTGINKIYAKQSTTFHIFDFTRNLSLQIIVTAVNVIVFYNAFQGNLSFGEMVLIIQLVNQAQYPLYGMSYILTRIQMAESGSKEFFEVMELPSKEQFTENKVSKKLSNPELSFKNVTFKYDSADGELKNVLSDISLQFKTNEKIALVGRSGAGKSTIVNLILNLYEPSAGQITLNGKSYAELGHEVVRSNIALVFQDNELFSSTVRENVAYGHPDATEEEVIKALKAANAYDFVMKFPKGLDTEVGERGLKLSGGQKQRIQIARAILKDAPILILDEATSSLDSESERAVQKGLENLMEKRLVIIIAHRFSTIQNVDRILVIEDGKISASGNPRDLAKQEGLYSTLLKYQIEGDKKLSENFELY